MGQMEKNIADVQETMEILSKEEVEVMHNFRTFMSSVLEKRVLHTKTKELIALVTAITGAAREEILETGSSLMGSPSDDLRHRGQKIAGRVRS